MHALGAFMEQAGQAFIDAGRFFGTITGVTATMEPLSFHLISISRVAARGRQDVALADALMRFGGRAAMASASTAGASAGRPFWQSTHLHAATHLLPALKQTQ